MQPVGQPYLDQKSIILPTPVKADLPILNSTKLTIRVWFKRCRCPTNSRFLPLHIQSRRTSRQRPVNSTQEVQSSKKYVSIICKTTKMALTLRSRWWSMNISLRLRRPLTYRSRSLDSSLRTHLLKLVSRSTRRRGRASLISRSSGSTVLTRRGKALIQVNLMPLPKTSRKCNRPASSTALYPVVNDLRPKIQTLAPPLVSSKEGKWHRAAARRCRHPERTSRSLISRISKLSLIRRQKFLEDLKHL